MNSATEIITVKFGTTAPIKFREYDERHPKIDLELEFRAEGASSVYAYNNAMYGNSEEIAAKNRDSRKKE